MRFQAIMLPTPGSRVGSVCGPGEFPRDHVGTVLCHVTDCWGTHAVILMDAGGTKTCESLNAGPGIGWHLISGSAVPAGYTDEYVAHSSDNSMCLRILTKPDADMDSTFRAWCLDSDEFLDMNGWLWGYERIESTASDEADSA